MHPLPAIPGCSQCTADFEGKALSIEDWQALFFLTVNLQDFRLSATMLQLPGQLRTGEVVVCRRQKSQTLQRPSFR